MPQPITKIVPKPYVAINTNVLAANPDMAVLVTNIIGIWASIERQLSVLLVRLLGANATAAHSIFSILQTQALQTKALEAAAKSALNEHDYEVFGAAMTVVESVQKTRNKLAHWVWGECRERPELLLLGDPKSMKERDSRVAALWQSMKPGDEFDINLVWEKVQFDDSAFLAFTKADLEREVRDLNAADHIVSIFGSYLDPSFSLMHAKAFDLPESAEFLRAQLLVKLIEQPLFRTALDQKRAGRKSNPLRPNGSNPQEPVE